MKKYFLAQILFITITFCFGQSKILVTDLTKIKQASNLQTSPDRKTAVFSIKNIEINAENKLEFDYRFMVYRFYYNKSIDLWY
jgi:hypothetical protein